MTRSIFLTGASSGIGRAAALELVAAGHRVWGTSRQRERLPTVEGFHPVVVDLLDPAATERAFTQASVESGGFDLLINNAGAGIFAPLEGITDEQLHTQWRLLYLAPLQLIRLALPSFRRRNFGRVINVTSLAARLPIPFLSSYNAAKAALSAATETLRYELSSTRIQFVDLQPGDICTPFHDAMVRADEPWQNAYYPTMQQAWRSIDNSMRQAPSPQLVARALVSLAVMTNPPPRVAVGDFFQATLAPLALRLLPKSLMEWAVMRFYQLAALPVRPVPRTLPNPPPTEFSNRTPAPEK